MYRLTTLTHSILYLLVALIVTGCGKSTLEKLLDSIPVAVKVSADLNEPLKQVFFNTNSQTNRILTAYLTVDDGERIEMSLTDQTASATALDLLPNSSFSFTVAFEYQLTGALKKTALLAQATREYTTVTGAGNNQLNFPASDFNGEALDLDSDGVSNLTEVSSDVNPFGPGTLITSSTTFIIDENKTEIGTIELIPGQVNTTVSFTVFGTDQASVNIDDTGQLTFNNPPNYEQPSDSNQDNIYEFTLQIDDGGRTLDQPIKVTVLDLHDLDVAFGVKKLLFSWGAWAGASYYKLILYSPDSPNGKQVSNDVYDTQVTLRLANHLHDWNNTTYSLEAYDDNFGRLIESKKISIISGLAETIGHFKETPPPLDQNQYGSSVSISSNGQTFVVAAISCNCVYVYTKTSLFSEWSMPVKLQGANTEPGDGFGKSASLSGNGQILAVGANNEDGKATTKTYIIPDTNNDDESQPSAGAVYLYEYDNPNNSWIQIAYIKALNAEQGDNFGYAIDLSYDGNALAVGAIGEDGKARRYYKVDMPKVSTTVNTDDNSELGSGAAYIFTRDEISRRWSQLAYVKARNAESGDFFGTDIDISGKSGLTLVVGAPGEDGGYDSNKAIPDLTRPGNIDDNSQVDAGAVYGFTGNTIKPSPDVVVDDLFQWSYIKASNAESGDKFGSQIALSQFLPEYLVVGAPNEKAGPNNNTISIPLSENDNDNLVFSGAAYVFTSPASNIWVQQAYLKALNAQNLALFGSALSINLNGDIIAVGAPGESGRAISLIESMPDLTDGSVAAMPYSRSGAAYVFRRNIDTGLWRQSAYLKGSKSMFNSAYGSSLDLGTGGSSLLGGASLLIGAPFDANLDSNDEFSPQIGGVYLY